MCWAPRGSIPENHSAEFFLETANFSLVSGVAKFLDGTKKAALFRFLRHQPGSNELFQYAACAGRFLAGEAVDPPVHINGQ